MDRANHHVGLIFSPLLLLTKTEDDRQHCGLFRMQFRKNTTVDITKVMMQSNKAYNENMTMYIVRYFLYLIHLVF